jgi:hypothetical protein
MSVWFFEQCVSQFWFLNRWNIVMMHGGTRGGGDGDGGRGDGGGDDDDELLKHTHPQTPFQTA